MKALTLSYLAGVMDSDGHIGVHVNWYKVKNNLEGVKQPTYQPRCSVKQIDPGAVELFHETFAGHRYLDDKNQKGSARPIHIWQVHSASCRRVLEALRPYLRIKGRQADLALELCDLNQSPRRHGWTIPEVIDGEPLLPMSEAAIRAGRSYAVAVQSVKLGNIPFTRIGARIYIPESYLETWRTRGRGARRRPEISARMGEINQEIKALNSGARGQFFPTPKR